MVPLKDSEVSLRADQNTDKPRQRRRDGHDVVFPEIDAGAIEWPQGMNITFVTSAQNDEQGRALLEAFGFPFRRQQAGV